MCVRVDPCVGGHVGIRVCIWWGPRSRGRGWEPPIRVPPHVYTDRPSPTTYLARGRERPVDVEERDDAGVGGRHPDAGGEGPGACMRT